MGMALPDGIRAAALKMLANGDGVTHIAESLGVSRARLYRDTEVRAAALARSERDPDPDPAPWDERGADDRPGLSRWDAELEGEQIAAFCKALRRTRKIPTAARAANVDLRPDRVRWADLSKAKREAVRTALERLKQPDPDPIADTRRALDDWLRGEPWPTDRDTVDVAELRALSPRAANNYESTVKARAITLARVQPKSKPDDSDWVPF